jgi:hypothetical protein
MAAYERPLRCYVSPTGRNKIIQWYESLSVVERADADLFIKNIRKVREWRLPDYRSLFEGIGELRWKSSGKQQRLLGYFSGDSWVALIGCRHKGPVYTPHNCLVTAKVRKAELERREVTTVEFDL